MSYRFSDTFDRFNRLSSRSHRRVIKRASSHCVETLESRVCLSVTFSSAIDYSTGEIPDFIASCDLNADGKRDLIVSSYNGSSREILLGNGNGTFGAPTDIALTCAPDFVTAGDVDGDGKADLVTASFDHNVVSVLLGNGDGTFQPEQLIPYSRQLRYWSLAVSDFKQDGWPDLIFADTWSQVTFVANATGK
jgi:hypothetical protein